MDYFDSNQTRMTDSDFASSHETSGAYATHMVHVMIVLEVVVFSLLVVLLRLMMKYIDQFNAEKDTIVKFNAIFISIYLGSKFNEHFLITPIQSKPVTNSCFYSTMKATCFNTVLT